MSVLALATAFVIGSLWTLDQLEVVPNLGRQPTVDDIVRLREQITKQFGIDVYGP